MASLRVGNFLNNLVDVDSASRMYSMLYDDLDSTSPEDIPIAGAYDFEAAFPSVGFGWCCITEKSLLIIHVFSKPL